MKLLSQSPLIRRPASERGPHAEAFRSRLWVFLAIMLLVAATFGDLDVKVAQAQANGAITGLTLNSDATGALTVSWDAASSTPTDYRVNWAKSGDNYPSWTSNDGNLYPAGTSQELTALEQGVLYKVRVRARYYRGSHEDSPWSGPWAEASLQVAGTQQQAATPTPEPTSTPVPIATPVAGALGGVTAADDGSGGLALSWRAPAAPHAEPTDYRVNWARSADEYPSYTEEDGNAHPTTTAHTLTGLDYDTEYKIQIRARYYRGSHEDSPWSGPWKEITGQVTQPQGVLSVPAAPNLMGTVLTPEGQVMLVWQNPSDDSITGDQVLRGPDADNLGVIEDDTGSDGTSYTDTSPPTGQTHTYAVKARNATGLSPRSNTVTATVPKPEPEEEELITSRQSTLPGSELAYFSNLGEAEAGRHQRTQIGLDIGQAYAQSFTTGSTAVTLEKVRLYVRGRPDPNPYLVARPSVTIRANSPVPGQPGQTLHVLTSPTIDSSIATYEDFTSDGYVLAANTTYWLVVHRPWGTDYFGFSATISESWCRGRGTPYETYLGTIVIIGPPESRTPPENAFTGEPGWSLDDYFFFGVGSGWRESNCWSMRVGVYASA